MFEQIFSSVGSAVMIGFAFGLLFGWVKKIW
jgi:hypothetical protein